MATVRSAAKSARKPARRPKGPGTRAGSRPKASRARRGKPVPRAAKQGPQAAAEHFAKFPLERRQPMLRLWAIVRSALPGSEAVVSYGIVIASVGGHWVAGVGSGKGHVGLYLMSPPFVKAQGPLLEGRDVSGGTVRFGLDEPLPAPLVRRLVRARLLDVGQRFRA